MSFLNFEYFFFEPIKFDAFYDEFKFIYNFQSPAHAKHIFNDWMIDFSHASYIFYKAQYDYHQNIIEKEFSIEHQIPEGCSFSEYGLEKEWEHFSHKNGLSEHHHEYEYWHSQIELQTEQARRENNIPKAFSAKQSVEKLRKNSDEISNHQRPTKKAIKEFWFNSVINNDIKVSKELRNIPYPDYLYTKHWRRVRAAMLLIHRGRCQAENCHSLGDSFYFGWEPEIDVHHLHYRNKGNERYSDLALLCKQDHKLWHYNQNNQKAQINIHDEVM